MSLSPAFLDELRARTLLSALIGRTLKITKAGREFKACCPFHNEKTPSFYINDEKGFYHCFGCSAHGDAIRWMTDQRGLGFVDAVKELADTAGMQVPAPDPQAAERAEKANSLYDVMTAAAAWFEEQLNGIDGAEARAYLESRGLSQQTIKRFGLGFSPDSRAKLKAALKHFGEDKLIEAGLLISVEDKEPYDRFRGRLMIPIRDPRGRVIAFGGRILGVGEPKYLNSPDTPLFDKGRTLYNLDLASAASRKSGRIIAVEGYLDVIAMAQAGIEDVVAPLGTALTEHQIERLWRYSNAPILCFDGDNAGQKAADRAARRALPPLRPGYSLEFLTLPDGKDPADMIQSGARAALMAMLSEQKQDISNRLWQSEVFAQPLTTPSSRAGLRQRLNELADQIANPIVRSEYQSTFKSLFWDTFGWGKKTVDATRTAFEAMRSKPPKKLSDMIIRAVLLGLGRHPDVIYETEESLVNLKIESNALREWKEVLLSAAFQRPNLEESLVDTILAESGVWPVERADLRRDLGFSFIFERSDADKRKTDLKEVIATLCVEQEIEIQLAQATERFKAATENEHFDEQQRLFRERERNRDRLNEFRENYVDAAENELSITG